MTKSVKWLSQHNIAHKKILMRVDLNVSIVNGILYDDTRIKATQASLDYLQGNRIILLTHLGQPTQASSQYSTIQIIPFLEKILKRQVVFVSAIEKVQDDAISLLENVRFFPQETQNDKDWAKGMAKHVDVFVNEAFSCSHRQHASIVQLPQFLPSYGGIHFEQEIQMLDKSLKNPLLLIVGGAKAKSKLSVIEELMKKAGHVFFGGITGNTFLKAKGIDIGQSRYDEKALDLAKRLLDQYTNIILPIDVVSQEGVFDVSDNRYSMILDIGPKTVDMLKHIIAKTSSIIWNGPLGWVEQDAYAQGSFGVSYAIKAIQEHTPVDVIVGGGDTLSILNKTQANVRYASTGGGAMLYYLAKHTLPGLESLKGQ